MSIVENISLKDFNTFGLEAKARYFCEIDSLESLRAAIQFKNQQTHDCLVLGGGSNVLFCQDYSGLVLLNRLRGIQIETVENDKVLVRAAAGENWHSFVQYCLDHGCYGLENLALIPGCVGAAPIQNIGAYGVEAGDLVSYVKVMDLLTGDIVSLSANECQFGYRDSVFKKELAGRKCIVEVGFELSQTPHPNVSYPALASELQDIVGPSPQQIFDAVCAVRSSKLPDPAKLGNAGSFFKNPVISSEHYQQLLEKFPAMPSFSMVSTDKEQGQVKVPAAWLIDNAGLKGEQLGGAAVHDKQALVIVNRGEASANDIVALATRVMERVELLYKIHLEPEVQWLPK